MDLKKQTTYEEQVELIKSKGITINDEQNCVDFLKEVSYYRFSAYFLPFRNTHTKELLCELDFERLQKIYEFDCELRNLIFSAIEKIEIHLRTQLAYFHAQKYGPEGYRSAKFYNKNHRHAEFSHRLTGCIAENSKSLVVQHHVAKYDGRFPIWVIIEFFSMGMLSHFYRGFETQDKKQVAKLLYNTNYKNLESWFRCLTDLRNRCAHYSRLYYWVFPAIPKMPTDVNYVPTRRLFSQLYMLKLMYPSSSDWNQEFLKPLIKLVNKYKPYISLKHLDFPYRWKSMLTK